MSAPRLILAALASGLVLAACAPGGTAVVGGAPEALAMMGLTRDQAGQAFGMVVTEGAVTRLTDVRFTLGGVPARAAQVRLFDLGTRGERPTFSRIEVDALAIDLVESGASARVGSLVLSRPDPAVAAFVADVLAGRAATPPGFARLGFDTLQLRDVEAVALTPDGSVGERFAVRNLGFASTVAGRSVQARVQDLSALFGGGPDTLPNTLMMGDAVVQGFAFEAFLGTTPFGPLLMAQGAPLSRFTPARLNPIDPGFDSATVRDLRFNILGADLSTPLWEAAVTRDAKGVATGSRGRSAALSLVEGGAAPGAGPLAAPAGQFTDILGLATVTMAVEGAQTYAPAADAFGLEGVQVTAENLFEARMDLSVSGWGAAQAAAERANVTQQPADRAVLGATTVQRARLTIVDRGLVGQLRARAAATVPEADENQLDQLIAQLLAGQLQAVGVDPSDPAAIGALADFARGGRTLEVSLGANRPVSFAEAEVLTQAGLPAFPVQVVAR
jgi:hypothetical protein